MLKTLRNLLALIIVGVFCFQAAHALSLKMKKQKAEVEKNVEHTLKKAQKKCGCTPKVDINWEEYKTKSDMRSVNSSVSSAVGGMARVCKNYKKEVCAGVKTIKISWGKLHKSLKDGVLELGREQSDRGWGEQVVEKMIEENL